MTTIRLLIKELFNMKKTRITLNLNQEDYDFLIDFIQEKDTNISQLIRSIIHD